MIKRSELSNILRQLADFIESQPDESLDSILKQASSQKCAEPKQKNSKGKSKINIDTESLRKIADELIKLPSREAGEALLKEKVTNRVALETLARFLNLPVQRDDNVERLRAKIVENSIGSRLRSNAIQGNA